MELESTIVSINNQFLEHSSIQTALTSLDGLLKSLLPQIETHKRSGNGLQKFLKLQDNFRFNIVSHMVRPLDYIYTHLDDVPLETVVLYNRLLQGLLLVHPASRACFTNSVEMTKIIQFVGLDNGKTPFEITITFISTLLHILLKNLENFRVFEACNGCSIIIKKLNLSEFALPKDNSSKIANQQMLNFKVIEFLLFYMSDEEPLDSNDKRTVKAKSDYFRQDFPDIDNLIESLNNLKTI